MLCGKKNNKIKVLKYYLSKSKQAPIKLTFRKKGVGRNYGLIVKYRIILSIIRLSSHLFNFLLLRIEYCGHLPGSPFKLHDDGLQPGDEVLVGLPARVSVGQLVHVPRRELGGEPLSYFVVGQLLAYS